MKGIQKNNLVRRELVGATTASNLTFNEEVKKLKASGSTVYHFGFGESPFPVPECLVKALKEEAHHKEYLSINGIVELREGIVDLHFREHGLTFGVDRLIVGPGSKQLIYLILAVFNGAVVVPAPAWTTYAPQVRLAGRPLINCQTEPGSVGGFKLTPKLLEESIRGTDHKNILLILTNPGNPSTCYSEKELKDLSCFCRERNITVISDEIYAALKFEGKHHSIHEFYPEGTILTSGFSKWASAGGWRMGYAHFPQEMKVLQEAVSAAASQTHSCAPAPMQYACAKVLKENHRDLHQYMRDCSIILSAVGGYCQRELADEGVTGTVPEAGYYFLPDFGPLRSRLNARGIYTGRQMTRSMLEEANVALMASSNFLMPEEDLSTRFCFICFNGREALQGLQKLKKKSGEDNFTLGDDFVKSFCPDVVHGIESLRKWCKS